MIDYHLHTYRCCHATGTMDEYLVSAKKAGISEIGFADHFPLEKLNFTPDVPVTMQAHELELYFADIAALQKNALLPVRAGLEVDYLPGKEELTKKLLASYAPDYVIGSIHFLDGWDLTNPSEAGRFAEEDVDSVYERYFSAVFGLIESGLFDIVGHIDVVKKFSYFPRRQWFFLAEEACRLLSVNDLCVEVNTSGWRAPVAEQYPGEDFLRLLHARKVPVTLGSDAHCPEDVGAGIKKACALLKKIGFKEIAVFSDRKRSLRPL